MHVCFFSLSMYQTFLDDAWVNIDIRWNNFFCHLGNLMDFFEIVWLFVCLSFLLYILIVSKNWSSWIIENIIEEQSCQIQNLRDFCLFIACGVKKYGIGCLEDCGNCRYPTDCFHINGTCLSGCSSGYINHICKTRIHILILMKFCSTLNCIYFILYS